MRFIALLSLLFLSTCVQPMETPCSAALCPSGCCDADGRCRAASASNCGVNGAICLTCPPSSLCAAGQCVDLPITEDAGTDAGIPDAGFPDAGTTDAGIPDAGTEADAGMMFVDAGNPLCARAMPGFPPSERFARERSTTDLPDDEPGQYQVHVVYVEPGDRLVATPLDTNGDIRRSLEAGLNWYVTKTGSISPRFDRCDGIIDVTFLKMPASMPERSVAAGLDDTQTRGPAFTRDRVGRFVTSILNDPKKLYLIIWDGLAYQRCGGAAWPPDIADHFTAMYRGGIFSATFTSAAVSVGQSSLPIYTTNELPMPAAPFTATIDGETIQVAAVASNALTLSSPLTQSHPRLSTIRANTTTPDCRSTRMSPDGTQLGYFDLATMHEITHPLGIVARAAPDQVMPPYPYGHVGDSAQAGASDLMYTGATGWRCGSNAATPVTLTCEIDPGHRNYFRIPGTTSLVDSSRSVFMTPLPTGAVAPPSW